MNKIGRLKIVKHFTNLLQTLLIISLFAISPLSAQRSYSDTTEYFTLDECISYALKHQPQLKQSILNVDITRTTNAINVSGWLPQVGITANATHYFQLPTSYIPNVANPGSAPVRVQTGVKNAVIPELTATQAIFSPSLLYSVTSAHLLDKLARQSVDSSKIGLVNNVSKQFYNLLLTLEQIDVLKEDTARLARNLSDTYYQYVGGVVDKTDYKEATITLNNSKSQLKQTNESVRPMYAVLKQLIGYPVQKEFNVRFDTAQMMRDIAFDTTQQLDFEKRIEIQQMETAIALQHKATNYNKLAFLPSLSAFYDYFYQFQNNTTSDVFKNGYSYQYAGLSLNFPIFTGFSRIESIHRSKLQEKVLGLSDENLRLYVNYQYTQALADYKSNLYDLQAMQENVTIGKDVFDVVQLQYKQGIVPYLNVITAESNLITSEISYINALFRVLSSKIDLEKAMGEIPVKN